MATNIGGIYGQIGLDNKGFKSVLQQSKNDMARAALELEKSSRVKIDVGEWKKLSSQLRAIQARATETRKKMLKVAAGSDEAKKLKKELSGLNAMITTLKAVTAPGRREMKRLADEEKLAAKEAKRLADADKQAAKEALANARAQRQKKMAIITAASGTSGGALGRIGQAGAFGGAGAAAASAAIAAAAAGVGIGVEASKTAADIEMQTAAFEVMMKSASRAKAFVADLLDFAKNTPFEFAGLVENARLMMTFGFEAQKILPILRVVGDAAGGNADKIDRITVALGQMRAKTKVSADEMRQLTEAGIAGWEMIAQKIGVDVPTAMKMAENGQITAITGINAILDGMNKQFGGGMERASKTAVGAWSNVKDTVKIALAEMGTAINNELKPLLVQFAKDFPEGWEKFKAKAKIMWAAVKPLLGQMIAALKDISPLLKLIGALIASFSVGALYAVVAAFRAIAWVVGIVAKAFNWLYKSVAKLAGHKKAPATGHKKAPSRVARQEGSYLQDANPAAVDPAQQSAISSAASAIASMNRELALNGDSSAYAAMQYDVLNGEYAKADEATKKQLLSLAKQKDMQDAAREAAKKHGEEQKKLAEKAKQAAEAMKSHYAQKLQETLDNMKSWAGKMAEAMKSFADETLRTVKDQLNKERDARNAAADADKSRYEKLAELGNIGARAMTNVVMFRGGKEQEDITAADLTPGRIRKAAQEVQAKRGNEAAMAGKVQGSLFGNGIAQYEEFSKGKGMDMFGVKLDDQITILKDLVKIASSQLFAFENLSRVRP